MEVKKEIVEKKLFGEVAGYIYVVEFHKRGLPHAHFLIILNSDSRIRTLEQYDDYVYAEIPDASENSHLHAAVVKNMMHGPCGRDFPNNPCIRNSICKNHYPRDFSEMTTYGCNSYPIYHRCVDGRVAAVRGASLDNEWVIPYNPFLLSKYVCHIKVEICSTVKAVKYLYKYVYKGHDRVSLAVTDEHNLQVVNKVAAYQNACWVSPPEAAWRIFSFRLNEIHANIVVLQFHLQNMQTVTFHCFEQLQMLLKMILMVGPC
ncbi:uncharacterized protein LOC141619936 [Silene latifolia]|uniref:uncharacterized protein LOC141619936 n=1 Tax=Silene latifolia TaxID=37657 RepID=UPI003D775E59